MRVRMRTSPLHTTLKCDVIKALRTGANHSKIVNNENETHKPLATTPHARPPGHRGNMKHDPSPYRLLPTISSWKWKLMLPFPLLHPWQPLTYSPSMSIRPQPSQSRPPGGCEQLTVPQWPRTARYHSIFFFFVKRRSGERNIPV